MTIRLHGKVPALDWGLNHPIFSKKEPKTINKYPPSANITAEIIALCNVIYTFLEQKL